MVDFGEFLRVHLAKSAVLTSTSVPLGSFKICSDAKEESGVRKASLVPEDELEDLLSIELQSRFLLLQ